MKVIDSSINLSSSSESLKNNEGQGSEIVFVIHDPPDLSTITSESNNNGETQQIHSQTKEPVPIQSSPEAMVHFQKCNTKNIIESEPEQHTSSTELLNTTKLSNPTSVTKYVFVIYYKI